MHIDVGLHNYFCNMCLCIYIHTYAHICLPTYMYVCTYIHMYVCNMSMYGHTLIHICLHTYSFMHTLTDSGMSTNIHTQMYTST